MERKWFKKAKSHLTNGLCAQHENPAGAQCFQSGNHGRHTLNVPNVPIFYHLDDSGSCCANLRCSAMSDFETFVLGWTVPEWLRTQQISNNDQTQQQQKKCDPGFGQTN